MPTFDPNNVKQASGDRKKKKTPMLGDKGDNPECLSIEINDRLTHSLKASSVKPD